MYGLLLISMTVLPFLPSIPPQAKVNFSPSNHYLRRGTGWGVRVGLGPHTYLVGPSVFALLLSNYVTLVKLQSLSNLCPFVSETRQSALHSGGKLLSPQGSATRSALVNGPNMTV